MTAGSTRRERSASDDCGLNGVRNSSSDTASTSTTSTSNGVTIDLRCELRECCGNDVEVREEELARARVQRGAVIGYRY